MSGNSSAPSEKVQAVEVKPVRRRGRPRKKPLAVQHEQPCAGEQMGRPSNSSARPDRSQDSNEGCNQADDGGFSRVEGQRCDDASSNGRGENSSSSHDKASQKEFKLGQGPDGGGGTKRLRSTSGSPMAHHESPAKQKRRHSGVSSPSVGGTVSSNAPPSPEPRMATERERKLGSSTRLSSISAGSPQPNTGVASQDRSHSAAAQGKRSSAGGGSGSPRRGRSTTVAAERSLRNQTPDIRRKAGT